MDASVFNAVRLGSVRGLEDDETLTGRLYPHIYTHVLWMMDH